MDCVAPLLSVPSRCGSPLLLLTCALLMTSSHSEGQLEEVQKQFQVEAVCFDGGVV